MCKDSRIDIENGDWVPVFDDVAIANAHGMWIEECRLFVKRASLRQGEKAEPHNQKMHFHRDHMKVNSHLLDSSPTRKRTKEDQLNKSMFQGKFYANAVKGVIEAKGMIKENVITLRMQAEETDWLSTSAVAKSHLDVVVDDLAKNLNLEVMLKVQVRSLGGRNFLLTFPTTEDRNKMVQDNNFGRWFSSLQPWIGEAAGVERLAWLSCYGVPLNAWGQNLFKSIGNIWGSFIRIDANTSQHSSFDKGRILIATEAKSKMDSWINVDIKGVCYPIKVIEEDYFISKLLKEDGLSDSSSGDETKKEDADMDIPIEKTTNVAENVLEVGNAIAMTSQSRTVVDVSSNSCVEDGFLALDDAKAPQMEGINLMGDLRPASIRRRIRRQAFFECSSDQETDGMDDSESFGTQRLLDVEK
ncbi:hypothetical protein Vadar_002929 [Vaccinium darrowii]|uniref:Uncharacterized protein n=1 Tax=Vaccinium darrowii TaxID=229202 RepID=A0ACB7XWD9_9ERIC|nr:hypothetical protein Vadar_002929 [Vaccinium darrowii]